jgi:very-short-patch-repair endonuclease
VRAGARPRAPVVERHDRSRVPLLKRRLIVSMSARIVADRRLLTDRAKSLRRDSTEAERRLWGALRNRRLGGIRFRRQVVVGRYVADFCAAHPKLIVELDGGQHEDHKQYDAARTRFLEANGYLVLRFWNTDVFVRLDDVLTTIGEEARRLEPE